MKKPALLIIDPSPAYFSPSSPLSFSTGTSATTTSAIKELLQASREGKVPIIWSQVQYTHPQMRDAGLLSKKMAGLEVFSASNANSAPLWLPELSPEVQERGEITLFRKFPSVFFGTNFATQLHALNVDTLVICGACTSGSVRATTLDAMQSGFRAMVVREGCIDRTREIHFANLFDLDAKYGDVVCSEEAMEKLRSGW